MDNDLEELIVVNPDLTLLKVARELCHFHGGIAWYNSLDDYINEFSGLIPLESKQMEIQEEKLPKDTSPHDLYTKCKTCAVEFRVGIRTNPRSFVTSQFIGNVHVCPNGHANSYNKNDYTLKIVQN
jgi:hypothetical protein